MAFSVTVIEGGCTFAPTTGIVPPAASLELHVDALLGGGRAVMLSRRVNAEAVGGSDDAFEELFSMLSLARLGEYGRVEMDIAKAATPIDVTEADQQSSVALAPTPVARQPSLPIQPGELNPFKVCAAMLEHADTSRCRLASMQQRVRACFLLDGAPRADRDDELCGSAVAQRDAARFELMQRLQATIAHAESACNERAKAFSDEVDGLAGVEEQLGAQPRMRLVALRQEALPLISSCMRDVDRSRVELAELQTVDTAEMSSLQAMYQEWVQASEAFIDAEADEKKGKIGAAAALERARAQVQLAESALRSGRTALSALASVHLPEWLALEPILRLGEVDGVSIPGMLVTRQLSHYTRLETMSGPPATQHHIFSASFNGKRCVLKEYALDGEGKDWRKLQREVRILSELRHPLIAEIECLFECDRTGVRCAYMQLRHYDAGDMQAWLRREVPGVLPRKAALHQVAQALQHLHGHGFAHGDVKLANILMATQGEGVWNACLADFETSRSTASMSAPPSAVLGTNHYRAPELLVPSSSSAPAPAPTLAADMYAYGISVLTATCRDGSFSFSPAGALLMWHDGAREAEASDQRYTHLLSLLGALLLDTAGTRLDATGAALHPFVDPTAARLLAEEAREMADRHRLEITSAAEAERLRMEEEERRHRSRIENAAAEQRRALREAEEASRRHDVELQRREVEVATANRRLKEQERVSREERTHSEAERRRLEDERRRAATASREAEAARDAAQREQRRVSAMAAERRTPPTYWQPSIAKTARANDGFALVSLDRRRDASIWATLQSLLRTDPAQLSQGRDVRQPGVYDRLELACAWRLEHQKLWDRYVSGQRQIQEQVARLRRNGVVSSALALKTDHARVPGGLNVEANERVLLHGTKPDALFSILSNGPNEHFSGGLFGHGTYFAEDVGKNDQYVTADSAHDASGGRKELHTRLFAKVRHPGKLYYLLVCRVSLGHSVRTQDGRTSMDGGASVFAASDSRELAAVPRASPPVHFHSLVAETGGRIARFREFIVFHGSYIYPEYLLAFQRMGSNGAV